MKKIKKKVTINSIIEHANELHLIMSQVSLLQDLTNEQLKNNVNLFTEQISLILDDLYKFHDDMEKLIGK